MKHQQVVSDPYIGAPSQQYKVWESSTYENEQLCGINLNTVIDLPNPSDQLSLIDLFYVALRSSPQLSGSFQYARESAALYGASLSSYFPALSFNTDIITERGGTIFNNTYVEEHLTSYGPSIGLEYVLWDSGARKSNSEYFFQMLQSANFKHNQLMQTVLQEVAKNYYEILYAKELLNAYETDLIHATESLKAANKKLEHGIIGQEDHLQTETLYIQKKLNLISQKNYLKNAYINLLESMGIPTNCNFFLGEFATNPPLEIINESEDEYINIAHKMRPEMLAAKAELLAKEAQLENAKSNELPKISLKGSGGETWYSSGEQDRGNYSVSLSLGFPIFSGFYFQNEIEEKESMLKGAIAQLRQVQLEVTKEVQIAINNFTTAKDSLELSQQFFTLAEKEYNVMLAKYEEGTVNILDLLSAIAKASEASATLAKAKRDYYVSIINFNFSIGSLYGTYDFKPTRDDEEDHCAHFNSRTFD